MNLTRQQIKFLHFVSEGYPFKLGCNEKGITVGGIPDFNSTLYLTLTLRSLLNRELILIEDNAIIMTNKANEELFTLCERYPDNEEQND